MLCPLLSLCSWFVLGVGFTLNVSHTPTQTNTDTHAHTQADTLLEIVSSHLLLELFIWSFLPVCVYAILMVGQHSMLLATNMTTNEVMNRGRYRYGRVCGCVTCLSENVCV